MFGTCCINIGDQTQQGNGPTTTGNSNNSPNSTLTKNTSVARPYIPQLLNWPPPLPTHPPHHTIPPLPTHPPSPGYPTLPPSAWPPTQKPITQFPIYQPTQIPINKPITVKPVTVRPTPAPAKPIADTPVAAYGSCGAKNGHQDQGKIVGGHEAEPNEWPWIAGLFNAGRQFCGGSLIDNIHILSAAHCVAQ